MSNADPETAEQPTESVLTASLGNLRDALDAEITDLEEHLEDTQAGADTDLLYQEMTADDVETVTIEADLPPAEALAVIRGLDEKIAEARNDANPLVELLVARGLRAILEDADLDAIETSFQNFRELGEEGADA